MCEASSSSAAIAAPTLHARSLDTGKCAGVQEQFQDGKVLIFKKRRRKNSRRLNGHRQVRRLTLGIQPVHGVPVLVRMHVALVHMIEWGLFICAGSDDAENTRDCAALVI